MSVSRFHRQIPVVDPGLVVDWVYRGTPDPHSARTDGRYGQTGGAINLLLTC
jgi:hypothetical protein